MPYPEGTLPVRWFQRCRIRRVSLEEAKVGRVLGAGSGIHLRHDVDVG